MLSHSPRLSRKVRISVESTLNLYLNLATVLIAVYGIFYSLSVASEQSGEVGDIPPAVYTFGKVCWAMVLLLIVTTMGAAKLAIDAELGGHVWLLVSAYLAVTAFLTWVSWTQLKVRGPRE